MSATLAGEANIVVAMGDEGNDGSDGSDEVALATQSCRVSYLLIRATASAER